DKGHILAPTPPAKIRYFIIKLLRFIIALSPKLDISARFNVQIVGYNTISFYNNNQSFFKTSDRRKYLK
ncbi:MAG TPA: hypothetical protein PK899_08545, partial [Spirochaetota bacterium]|nr:hypothetical protein [Spirochaetota bacterium]